MPFPRAARATRWTRSVLVFFAFVTLFAAAPASAEWRRIDSPNFVVVGDVGARTLRDIAVKFEGFRETLSRVLSDKVTATAIPTVVIAFPSDRAFTPFKPKFKGKAIEVDGLFVGRQDVNYIAVRSDLGEEGLRIVFHEYAHLIISNIARNIPVAERGARRVLQHVRAGRWRQAGGHRNACRVAHHHPQPGAAAAARTAAEGG
jgi:hypothetical protein